MSFTRAKLKRFNENTGCAPPVGAYDPKALETIPNCAVSREDRFKVPKVLDPLSMCDMSTISSGSVTPLKGVRHSTPGKAGWNKVSSCDSLVCRGRHLSDEMTEIRAELRRRECEIGELQRQLDASREELERAGARLKDLGATNGGLERNNFKLKSHFEQQKLEMLEVQGTRDKLKNERDTLMERLATGEEKHKTLQDEMRRVIAEGEHRLTVVYDQLTLQLRAAEDQLSGLESVTDDCHASLQECKDSLLTEVTALKSIIKQFNFQKFDDEDSIRYLKGEVFVALDEEAQARAALGTMAKDVTVLVSQINCLQVNDDVLNANIRSISQQYEILENCLGSFEQVSRERERILREKCSEAEERCIQVRLECDSLREANDDLQSSVDNEKKASLQKSQRLQEMDVMGEVVSRELREAQQELGKIREENKRRRSLLKSLEQSKHDLESGLSEAQGELRAAVAAHGIESQRIAVLLDESHQQVVLLRDAAAVKSLECVAVEERAVTAERLLAETKDEFERVQEDIQTLGVDSAHHRAEIEWLKVEKSELHAEVERLNSDMATQCESSRDEVSELHAEVEQLNSDMVTQREASREEVSELHAEVERLNSDMATQCESSRDEVSGLHAEVERLNSDMATQREASREEVVVLQLRVDEKQRELVEAQQSMASLERRLVEVGDELKSRVATHRKTEETLREELREVSVEVEQLKTTVVDMEERVGDVNHKHDSVVEQCRVLRETHDAHVADGHVEIERLERDKRATERDLAEVRCTLDKLRVAESEHCDAMVSSEDALQRSRESNAELKLDIKSAQHELDMLTSESNAHELLLQQELAESRSKVGRLTESNTRLNESLTEMTESRDASEKVVSELRQKVHEKKTVVMHLTDRNDELLIQVETLEKERTLSTLLEDKYTQLEHQSQTRLLELEVKLTDSQDLMEQQCVALENCLECRSEQLKEQYEAALLERDRDVYEMQVNLQSAEAELQSAVHQYDADLAAVEGRHQSLITDLRRSFEETTTSKEDMDKLQQDTDRWRRMYEALWEKVLPFQEQLEAFEAEKQALLGRTHNAQHEMDKLSRDYARLLGHQNQKQKIRHVLKLKEENNELKQQVCGLQEQSRRQLAKLAKLETKLQSTDGATSSKRHFDLTKAFRHTKENVVRSPLREGNRKAGDRL